MLSKLHTILFGLAAVFIPIAFGVALVNRQAGELLAWLIFLLVLSGLVSNLCFGTIDDQDTDNE